MIIYEQVANAYKALFEPHETIIWLNKALNIGRTLDIDVSRITRLEERIQQMLHAPQ